MKVRRERKKRGEKVSTVKEEGGNKMSNNYRKVYHSMPKEGYKAIFLGRETEG